MTILRIDSSVNLKASASRALTDQIVQHLPTQDVITRDIAATSLPHITQAWTETRLVPQAERSEADRKVLALSEALIGELRAADTLVIGVPVYNFSIPASLKAWIDLIAIPGETFQYTANGPKGLLEGKRALLAFASGGTQMGSDIDFATGYLRHVLGFVGITDVHAFSAAEVNQSPNMLHDVLTAVDTPLSQVA